jgi:hypothetical protein
MRAKISVYFAILLSITSGVLLHTLLVNTAGASPFKSISGQSSCINAGTCGPDNPTSSVKCADGRTIPVTYTFISVNKNSKSGQVVGFFTVASPTDQTSVQVTLAQVSSNSFKIQGQSGLELCSPTTGPVVASLSGPCGTNVELQYKATGEAGRISNVNVACTK